MTTKDAVNHLATELDKDKSEGSYYYTWQSNIAMSFYDAYQKEFGKSDKMGVIISEIANDAAKNFLDLLISQSNK